MKHFILILILFVSYININAQQDTLLDEFSTNILNEEKTNKGAEGSFGKSLSQLSSFVSLNGYATNEFLFYENGVNTFNQHYFNLLASAEISNHIFAEIQLEYEYAGSSLEARYAQIDYKFNDLFILRSGKFLVPAGEYNEYLYPEFISKTTNRAFVNLYIIPVSWGDVGVQLRGQLKLNKNSKFRPFYSFYVINGLKSMDGSTDIRNMRGNFLDTLSGTLAYGGNLGAEIGDFFNFQFNYYKGDYDPNGELDLSLFGSSLGFDNNKLSFYAAFHAAKQEVILNGQDNELFKYGFYALAAYKYKNFEPVIRYDQIRLDGLDTDDKDRWTFGLNYHFYENCVIKVNYELIKNKGVDLEDNLFSIQLAVGF
ncbi:MAG: hypothetical protein L3J74_07020 [Bacteroidales bacterium]|nr:hypothetical protein [Bacteroidales bacterium]